MMCGFCGEELEEKAKFCSRCGKPQTGPEKRQKKKGTAKRKVLNIDNLTLRQYFQETAKSGEYTEETAAGLRAFLDRKGMDKSLFSKAEKMLKEMCALYAKYEILKAKDKSFAEIQKGFATMRAKADELYHDFEQSVEEVRKKNEKREEGKKKFDDFNQKKRKIYEKLKYTSPNDGSCDDKDCGYNNCLTLAMKIASGKDDYDSCPYVDDEGGDAGYTFF